MSPTHLTTAAGAAPYKSLFSTVTLVPATAQLAYISTQWACDNNTGEFTAGTAGDYRAQSKITWEHVVGILQELGVTFKDIVHRTISFKDFNEDIGKEVVEGMLAIVPDEWKGDIFKSALTFNGAGYFHAPGIVYAVELVVAVPAK